MLPFAIDLALSIFYLFVHFDSFMLQSFQSSPISSFLFLSHLKFFNGINNCKGTCMQFSSFIFHFFVGFALHTRQFTSPNSQNVWTYRWSVNLPFISMIKNKNGCGGLKCFWVHYVTSSSFTSKVWTLECEYKLCTPWSIALGMPLILVVLPNI